MYFGLASAARRLLSKGEELVEECDINWPSHESMNDDVVAEESFMDCRDLGGSSSMGDRTPLLDDLGYFDDEYPSINANSFVENSIQSNHRRVRFCCVFYSSFDIFGVLE